MKTFVPPTQQLLTLRSALVLALAMAATLAACSDSPTEPQVTSVQITAPSQEVRTGETLQLTGTPVDAQGNEMPGGTLTWSSSNEGRATVSDDGLVTGIAPGQVTIMAQTGDASGQIILQVLQPPVASVEVVPAELELRRQQEVQLEVVLRDADGNELGERSVAWSTEDAAVASVSAQGVVVGQGEGQTRIVASVDGVEGHTDVTVVVVGDIPIIESILPEVLEPGESFTITGEKFAEDELEVRVHGATATILAASETSITARVPDDLCRPEGPAPILVFSALEPSDPLDHPYRPTDLLELAAGEHQRFTSPSPFCVILGGAEQEAEYIMGVQSTSGTAASRTPVRVEGFAGQSLPVTATAAPPQGTSFAAETARRIRGAAGLSDRDLRWARHREAKPELRQAEAEAMTQVRLGGGPDRPALTDHAPRISGDVQVGDTVPVNVPDINASICNDFSTIQGIIQRVGQRSIWVEDAANPAGGFTDDDYALLADEFDNEIYDEAVSYFGEPTDLDENERIVIVNTRKVNEMSANTLGFVVSTDFFPDQCDSSNGGEYYYSRVVDPDGSITDPDGESREYSRSDALADAPLLLAHEVTHIIQFGRRFHTLGLMSAQAIWLLEGQATIAEEVVGHRYTGNSPGSNLDEFTAFSPANPTDTFWYRNPFVDLSIYFGVAFLEDQSTFKVDGAPEECGWLSVREPEPCISGRIAYGVTWSLLRWISDHFASEFAGGEREIQQRLVDSPETGFATFDDVLGEDIFQLMAPWAATLYTEGRVETGDPLLTLPSWDLRSIEAWISEPARWGDPARLEPADHPFSHDFQSNFVVAAGSSTYQRLASDDGHPPFALLAGAGDGGPLPDFLQLWIARIR